MEMREKLIYLCDTNNGYVDEEPADKFADYLIANDVVPVVRCKDYAYYKEPCREFNYHHCSHSQWDDSDGGAREIDPVAFCSYGERKSDES